MLKDTQSVVQAQEPQEKACDALPFFPDEAAFLNAVFEHWAYFVRALTKIYPKLVTRYRETGTVHAGWRAYLDMTDSTKSAGTCDCVIGSCDVEDIIVDAIERCTKDPALQAFYTNYQPHYAGRDVNFKTWFMTVLRSCAKDRKKAAVRRNAKRVQRETAENIPESMEVSDGKPMPVTTFLDQDAGRTENGDFSDVESAETGDVFDEYAYKKWAKEARQGASSRLETYCNAEHLLSCLTDEEQDILTAYRFYGTSCKAFAEAIGYEYDKARSKVSYIIRKLRVNCGRINEENAINSPQNDYSSRITYRHV